MTNIVTSLWLIDVVLLSRGRRSHQAMDGYWREVLQDGETPLTLATRNGHSAIQYLLRGRGALAVLDEVEQDEMNNDNDDEEDGDIIDEGEDDVDEDGFGDDGDDSDDDEEEK